MKGVFTILSFMCFAILFSQKGEGEFEIYGEIEGAKRGKVQINFQGVRQHVLETKLDDGKFVIKGELVRPIRVTLYYKNTYSVPFYIENNKINISFYKDKFINIVDTVRQELRKKYSKRDIYAIRSIEGSASEDLYRDYIQFKKNNIEHKDYKHLLFAYLDEQMDKNQNDVVYASIINQYCRRPEHLSYPQIIHLLSKIDMSQLNAFMKRSLLRNIKKLKDFAPGKFFPETYALDQYGNEQLLSRSYGKYTLIDFWASICTRCTARYPQLKALYNNYKAEGFEVIGISVDRDAKTWKLAFENHKLPWINYLSNSSTLALGVSTIPYTYLLDEKGRIVGVNLSTDEIEALLKKNL